MTGDKPRARPANVGAIQRRGSFWVISADPQVVISLKRNFARVDRASDGEIRIRSTPEVDRDIQWFRERWPLDMEPKDELLLHQGAEMMRARERMSADIDAGTYVARDFVGMAKPPRDYQRIAADMCLKNGSLLCADSMGLGKTVTAITMLSDQRTLPAVVVTISAGMCHQWVEKLEEFLPHLRTHIIEGTRPYDIPTRCVALAKRANQHWPAGAMPDVLVVADSRIAGWMDVLKHRAASLVLDECQGFRHPGTEKAKAAAAIRSRATFCLGLSGTPVHGYGGQYFNVMEMIRPGALGERDEFYREWCVDVQDERKARVYDPRAFGLHLRASGLMIQRSRKDVGRELPALTNIPTSVECNMAALDKVKHRVMELARTILRQGGDVLGRSTLRDAGGEMDRLLRQATGVAKCLAPGTLVTMLDGSKRRAEHVGVGDLLMGPDSLARNVRSVIRGEGELFEVRSTARPPLFEPYVVNGDHVLALRHSGKIRHGDRFLFAPYLCGDHLEMTVREYLGKSAHFHHMTKGYKVGVEFPTRAQTLDPYFFGLWLGDGTSKHAAVTTADPEIVAYLTGFAAGHGLAIRVKAPHRRAPTYCISAGTPVGVKRNGRNPVLTALQELGVLGRKHIPDAYLLGSRKQRLSVLAGLLDSDGHLNAGGSFTVATKWSHLAGEIQQLAMSLGFASKVRAISAKCQTGAFPAFKISVAGSGLDEIPLLIPRKRGAARRQIKDALRSGIEVTPVGHGPFNGFTLDGDGLFLLGDFTVTHNSPAVAALIRMLVEQGEQVIVAAWHREVHSILKHLLGPDEASGAADLHPVFYTGAESDKQKRDNLVNFISGKSRVLVMSLRSGAGLDGLQHVCSTAVIAELSWVPQEHDQFVARIARDGQLKPCFAYYPLAEAGSDVVVADVCGAKRANSAPILTPDESRADQVQTDPEHIKKLARGYLDSHR